MVYPSNFILVPKRTREVNDALQIQLSYVERHFKRRISMPVETRINQKKHGIGRRLLRSTAASYATDSMNTFAKLYEKSKEQIQKREELEVQWRVPQLFSALPELVQLVTVTPKRFL